MATPDDELPEVGVSPRRDRFPGFIERFKRAGELSRGTFLPHVQAVINPGLFRERQDTNALMDSAFGEGGQLEELRQTDPQLYDALREASQDPMRPGEHRKFRSAILDMVQGEVERKQAIDGALADNAGYMRVFSAMDRALPGINDPDLETYEEGERQQMQLDYERAQQLAAAGDVEGAKSIMTEVRKRGDALSANNRQRMELDRKRAIIQDQGLYSGADNARQALRDASEDLERALAKVEREGGQVPDFVLQKALTAYGTAGALQQTSLGDAAASAAGAGVVGAGAGAAAGLPGVLIGAGTGVASVGIAELREHFKSKKNVQALAVALRDADAQVARNYQSNREKLAQSYAPSGIKFGAQPGEVYAVLADAYKAEADKVPESPPRTPEETNSDRVESHRVRLTKELERAKAALEAARPDAAANTPNARAKLDAANKAAIEAQDNLVLFEDDIARGGGSAEVASGSQLEEIRAARARRESEAKRRRAVDRQAGIVDALRSRLR